MMTNRPDKKRAGRDERGSVLVFVVGVLVLLALAATAYLSTARVDRQTTKQNEFTTQIDLLLEGVRQASIRALLDDDALEDNAATFKPYTHIRSNVYLASRVPTLFNVGNATFAGGTTSDLSATNAANPGLWSAVTGPFITGQFETPSGQIMAASERFNVIPFAANFAGRAQPALCVDYSTAANYQRSLGTDLTALGDNLRFAGDADGDGVADSLSEKLPVGKINGIEYFAFVRIIDNNAAINVNTAMSCIFDFSGANGQAFTSTSPKDLTLWKYGFFSGDVGLAELLRDYTAPPAGPSAGSPVTTASLGPNFQALIDFRTNTGGAAVVAAPPVNDAGAARADFGWFSLGDVFHHQLTTRQYNPGVISGSNRYQVFNTSEGTAVARKFVLIDPLGTSTLETTLAASLLNDQAGAIPSLAFDPFTSQTLWYSRFFNYTDTANRRSLRPLLVTESNTRNLLPTDAVANTILAFNTDATPKASINSAPFAELFRAYFMTFVNPKYSALAAVDRNAGTIYPSGLIAADYANGTGTPYKGMNFDDLTQDAVTTERHAAGVLRSPIRSTPTPGTGTYAAATNIRIDASEMAKLRAAIAAVNTEAMRRFRQPTHDTGTGITPDIIVPQDVNIIGTQGANAAYNLTVRVFGISRQPYITEVFAHTDQTTSTPPVGQPNPNGYIAIELYNPHDFPIDISNCRFGAVVRHGPTSQVAPWSTLGVFPRMVIEDLSKTSASNPARTDTIKFLLESGTSYVDSLPVDAIPDVDTTLVKSNLDDPTFYSHPLVVPARGYLIMENYDSSGTDTTAAKYRPGSVSGGLLQTPTGSVPSGRGVFPTDTRPGVNAAYVKNLHLLMNREFVLMRPLDATTADRVSASPPPLSTYGSTTPVTARALVYRATAPAQVLRNEFMPLDSYDLSGFMLANSAEGLSVAGRFTDNLIWHYNRQTPTLTDSNDTDAVPDRWSPDWQFVYPGRYNAAKSDTATDPLRYSYKARQQGTNQTLPFEPGVDPDPWDTTNTANPTAAAPIPAPNFGTAPVGVAQDKVFTIKLFDKDWPGPLTPSAATGNYFPFGQFSRPGDLYKVPFIGAYTIIVANEADNERIIEMNAVTTDAAMAEDTDVNTDPVATNANPALVDNAWDSREQIGRFVPLRAMDNAGNPYYGADAQGASAAAAYSDFVNDSGDGSNTLYRYAFGRRLLEYFTIDAPHDDGFPNALPANYPGTPVPEAVSNSGLAANSTAERPEARHGLVNINTASWKVLSMIPWVSSRDELQLDTATGGALGTGLVPGSNGVNDNEDFAKAFVIWRDGNPATTTSGYGPIESLTDLYKCPAFTQLQSTALMGEPDPASSVTDPNREPDDREGDLSPFNPAIQRNDMSTTDGIRYDFEEQMLLLTRVSNLLTTRSDTFTVYILLQGWRNAGGANAELVVERRAAMVVDRSQYTTDNGNVTATRVPTN